MIQIGEITVRKLSGNALVYCDSLGDATIVTIANE